MKIEFYLQFFKKYIYIKFHENPSFLRRVVSCGLTDRWPEKYDKTDSCFRHFANTSTTLTLQRICSRYLYLIVKFVLIHSFIFRRNYYFIGGGGSWWRNNLFHSNKGINESALTTSFYKYVLKQIQSAIRICVRSTLTVITTKQHKCMSKAYLTHWGLVTQFCVFNTRLFSLHNTLNYAIHRALSPNGPADGCL